MIHNASIHPFTLILCGAAYGLVSFGAGSMLMREIKVEKRCYTKGSDSDITCDNSRFISPGMIK